jgi:hypothetical protein
MFSRSTILLAAPFELRQQLDVDKIGTCTDIDCTLQDSSSPVPVCRVTNHTFHMVGIKTLLEAITEHGEDFT